MVVDTDRDMVAMEVRMADTAHRTGSLLGLGFRQLILICSFSAATAMVVQVINHHIVDIVAIP